MSTHLNSAALNQRRSRESAIGDNYSRVALDPRADDGAQVDRWVNEGGAVGRRLIGERLPRTTVTDALKKLGRCDINLQQGAES